MPPRKNKKIGLPCTVDGCECSSAANKRMRSDIMNATNGVPFTNPFTQFPSIHMLNQQPPAQNTVVVATDLQLSHPSLFQQQQLADDDGLVSSLVPQQNFIMTYHMNIMLQNLEQFWRGNLEEEVRKRKEIEARLKVIEECEQRYYRLFHSCEEKAVNLEDWVRQHRCSGEDNGRVVDDEEVDSSFNPPKRTDIMCKNCERRPATMLWLPCRHLCVCLVCERRVKNCPICREKKTESLKIDLP